jgi:hypothetical protein
VSLWPIVVLSWPVVMMAKMSRRLNQGRLRMPRVPIDGATLSRSHEAAGRSRETSITLLSW